jgi:hypothetical protein
MLALSFVLVLLAALGSGLMAGLFFVFSVAIMTALARLMPHEGVAAMQHINAVILNPLFALAFFGTAAVCLAVLIMGLALVETGRRLSHPRRRALSPVEHPGHSRLQRAAQRPPRCRRGGHARGRRALARLSRALDAVEPRAHARLHGGRRAAHRRHVVRGAKWVTTTEYYRACATASPPAWCAAWRAPGRCAAASSAA